MLGDVVRHLRCPHCATSFRADARVLRCGTGHAFDVARQGYVNLMIEPGAGTGDTAAMVAAREQVLRAGHLEAVTRALVEGAAALDAVPGCVLDLGAGTGHHLARVLDSLPDRVGVALDVSVPAARRAARAHARLGAVVADAWAPLPLPDATGALVLVAFAPRSGPEVARVLHPDGRLLVVSPEPDHLAELVGALGLLHVDARKAERLAASLGPRLERVAEQRYAAVLSLRRAAASALAAMGPSAHHLDAGELARRVAGLPEPVDVSVAVRLSVWRRR